MELSLLALSQHSTIKHVEECPDSINRPATFTLDIDPPQRDCVSSYCLLGHKQSFHARCMLVVPADTLSWLTKHGYNTMLCKIVTECINVHVVHSFILFTLSQTAFSCEVHIQFGCASKYFNWLWYWCLYWRLVVFLYTAYLIPNSFSMQGTHWVYWKIILFY